MMMTEVKTREKALEELLEPGGKLNAEVYAAVLKLWKAQPTAEDPDDALLEELDNAINKYMQYAIEYDRLKRGQARCTISKHRDCE